ncbi:MAG TPA: rod shape-determining protein MreC [Bacteroidales bacterium]|nr:rod shape-determining protein MreC [Bacteroidales bacterium]HNQ82070.1 rod shape-determining protein MreC [Bacteroidales bacterium]HOX78965.1 rod shape-determining protein MreC [Bacteroidales bacterium]HPI85720.1 rod shape-determining protein MreC [Bacteroidales bacterium]HPM91655.1 rod shape-determining protein MreC [Bacteroidales bacterium]
MRNLLAFISRYQFLFFYLIFLVISFTLLYNNNYYQRSKVVGVTNGITGKFNTYYENMTSFIDLKRSNDELAKENARLRALLNLKTRIIPDSLVRLENDLTEKYISARIISNSTQYRNNFFMIDKGYTSGIKKDMGVIAGNGVVGIIIDVSEHYSSGISVLHKDSRISGRIKKNDQLVNVSWDGVNYRLGDISHIPTHVSLLPGDTILTSGNSRIFPEGLMIGTVEYVDDEMENMFKKGKVRFTVDYNKISYVYVVDNPTRGELNRLQTKTPNE